MLGVGYKDTFGLHSLYKISLTQFVSSNMNLNLFYQNDSYANGDKIFGLGLCIFILGAKLEKIFYLLIFVSLFVTSCKTSEAIQKIDFTPSWISSIPKDDSYIYFVVFSTGIDKKQC